MLHHAPLQQVGVDNAQRRPTRIVIPAEAGIPTRCRLDRHEPSSLWISAGAGVTR